MKASPVKLVYKFADGFKITRYLFELAVPESRELIDRLILSRGQAEILTA